MIAIRRPRVPGRRAGRAAIALRWGLVAAASLGALLVYTGDLWIGIGLWVCAVVAWQLLQAAGLWRSFGLAQRLRAARWDRRERGHR